MWERFRRRRRTRCTEAVGQAMLALGKVRRRMRAGLMGGLKSAVEGTPTFFVNGLWHDDHADLATLRAAVKEAAR